MGHGGEPIWLACHRLAVSLGLITFPGGIMTVEDRQSADDSEFAPGKAPGSPQELPGQAIDDHRSQPAAPDGSSSLPRDSAATNVAGATLYSAYESSLFIRNPVSSRVCAIVQRNRGGNYGLCGPRGAGKSWLMQAAKDEAEEREGVGLWFPSPSEYDALSFLAALSDVFAQRYIDYYIERSPYATVTRRRQWQMILAVVAIVLYAGVAILTLGIINFHLPHISTVTLVGFAIALSSLLVLSVSIFRRRQLKPKDQLYEKAVEFQRQARFTAALTESSQVSGGLSRSGLSAAFQRSRSSAYTERPATVSSLIHDFRKFSRSVAKTLDAPVVVAIDELDKMSSSEKVSELLKGVKGIFDVPGVHYFVSISDEAARRLDLGGIAERNEFNSSFYQVFRLPPLSLVGASNILQSREAELDDRAVAVVTVLSGGVPREVIRLADCALDLQQQPSEVGQPLEMAILKLQVEAFKDEIYSDPKTILTDVDRTFLRQHMETPLLDVRTFSEHPYLSLWNSPDDSSTWSDDLRQEYRRLLLRLAVGVELRKNPNLDAKTVDHLQSVIVRSAIDPAAGRDILSELAHLPAQRRPAASRSRRVRNPASDNGQAVG